jgi:hypothetical protein
MDLINPRASHSFTKMHSDLDVAEHAMSELLELSFADFYKRTIRYPGLTSIAGKANSGKTALASSTVGYLGALLLSANGSAEGKTLTTCDLILNGSRMKQRVHGNFCRHPAVIHSAFAFQKMVDQLGLSSTLKCPKFAKPESIASYDDLAKIAQAGLMMRKIYGPIVNVKNEVTTTDPGVTFQISDSTDLSGAGEAPYVVHSAMYKDQVDIDCATARMIPLDLVRAGSFYAATRVATVNSSFATTMKHTNVLKGGLDEGTLHIIQTMSDMASETAAHIVVELRDDFSTAKDYELDENGMSPSENRMMGVSKQAVYLQGLNAARTGMNLVYRYRDFHGTIGDFTMAIADYKGDSYPSPLDTRGNVMFAKAVAKYEDKTPYGAVISEHSSGYSGANAGVEFTLQGRK